MKILKGFPDALQFLYAHHFKSFKIRSVTTESISRHSTDIYHPLKSKGSILIVHGMSPLGNKDPRMIHLSKAVATCGYTAITPHFPDIAKLLISKKEISDIEKFTIRILNRKDLCPGGKTGMFSASFAGGMCLIAASRNTISERITSIISVGSHGDVSETVAYFMGKDNLDDYGTMIVLGNFIKYSSGENKELQKAFFLSALDNSRKSNQLEHYLKKMSSNNRKIFLKLKTSSIERSRTWKKIVRNSGKYGIHMEDLSPVQHIHELKANATFLHGNSDPVIPPAESLKMHKLLTDLNKNSHFVSTPILSHGDAAIGIGELPAVIQLAAGFSNFFGNLQS